MQFIDMKAMKSLYNHKTLFFSYPIKAPNQHCSFHFRSPQFHSTALRFLAGGSVDPSTGSDSSDKTQNAPQVWSFYNPLTSTIETQRSTNNSNSSNNKNDQESVPGLSNLKIRVSDNESEILNNRDINKMGLTRYSNENEELINEKRYASLKKADLVDNIVSNNNRKKGRSKVIYVCESCGNEDGQWWGICRSCGKAGTMKQFSDRDDRSGNSRVSGAEVTENMVRSWLPQKVSQTQPLRLKDVNQRMNQLNWRIPLPGLFGSEVARVLGGGVVPGSLILIGGDPGVGKSTLLLQVAAIIAEGQDVGKRDPVVYVSGEESVEQIVNRADRLSIGVEELFLYSSTDIEDILAKIQPLSPCALIIDSIQTAYIQGVSGSAGGISQVKECTSALLRFAKKTNIPVLLVGHVTKSGDIAGPRVLEHIVDVVLYLEGEKHSTHRLLRPVKNRFGSTDELGVFEMSQSGLQSVSNPSEIFLSEQYLGSEVLVGLAVAVIMDGSRSFLIEIQALCATGSSVSRHVNGIQANRADMIISVLKKQAGLMLQDNDIFLNVVSGVTLTETAGDLAIAAAICSSFLEFPIPNNVAFIGEIGLGGELRTVPRMEKRVHTVAKLGYKMCIVPKSANKYLSNLAFEGIQIIGCANLRQVIDAVFTKQR
ncbi:DNA repair protein RadA [Ricinus communis]|nr:DNA repair protein RadA [Ricinus communis]